jgi:hypothetical protein
LLAEEAVRAVQAAAPLTPWLRQPLRRRPVQTGRSKATQPQHQQRRVRKHRQPCSTGLGMHKCALHMQHTAPQSTHLRGEASLLVVVLVTLSVKLGTPKSSNSMPRSALPLDCARGGRRSLLLLRLKSAPEPEGPLRACFVQWHVGVLALLECLLACCVAPLSARTHRDHQALQDTHGTLTWTAGSAGWRLRSWIASGVSTPASRWCHHTTAPTQSRPTVLAVALLRCRAEPAAAAGAGA